MSSFFPKNYMPSYWDFNLPKQLDFCIIGAGFTGIGIAIGLREKYPKAEIALMERLPTGAAASTKNAGFLCFGSPTEILDSIETIGEKKTFDLLSLRRKGANTLNNICASLNINMVKTGGHEVFTDKISFAKTRDNLLVINALLKDIDPEMQWSQKKSTWAKIGHTLFSPAEQQIHPGTVHEALIKHLRKLNIPAYHSCTLTAHKKDGNNIAVEINGKMHLKTRCLLMATNAFQKGLKEVVPARNIVRLYKPQNQTSIKANIHYDRGYVYMRNVGKYFLIGGGRNVDMAHEQTDEFGENATVESYLEKSLYKLIKMHIEPEPLWQWSGIITTGKNGMPLFKRLTKNTYYVGRYAGMGVALSYHHGYSSGKTLEIE